MKVIVPSESKVIRIDVEKINKNLSCLIVYNCLLFVDHLLAYHQYMGLLSERSQVDLHLVVNKRKSFIIRFMAENKEERLLLGRDWILYYDNNSISFILADLTNWKNSNAPETTILWNGNNG